MNKFVSITAAMAVAVLCSARIAAAQLVAERDKQGRSEVADCVDRRCLCSRPEWRFCSSSRNPTNAIYPSEGMERAENWLRELCFDGGYHITD
jgi:hypothetical protein